MAQKRKTSSVAAINDKRVSRSVKKTPYCKTNGEGKPCCPKCRKVPGDSIDYEAGDVRGEVVFYYRCECGQTYRRVVKLSDI